MTQSHGAARSVLLVLGMAWLLLLGISVTSVAAQEPFRIAFGRLSFPSHVAMITDVIKGQGLDRKNGIDLDLRNFGAVSAFYAAQATGEVQGGIGGPLVYQKMRLEGAPIKAVATLVDMTSMVIIARDPKIQSFNDLRGKTIAADMASSEYQVLTVYAKNKGIVLGRDITVIQAGPPLARTQLAADRVSAAMTWEPSATLTMRDNPGNRIIFNARQAWREITGKDGWLLVLGAHEEFIRKNPAAIPRLVATFQDGARFMRSNPDEADRIVSQSLNLPPGAFKEMVTTPRVVFEVRPTTDAAARDSIWEVIKVAIGEGFFKQPVPDQSILYVP